MYETYVTVTGVVATDPRAVILDETLRITNFRLASTSRRRDRSGQWVDGQTTWFTVTCWRGLAANVAESIGKKDRVVVHGRLRSQDWTAQDGTQRTSLEIEADAVGHDLSFGTSTYTRVRRAEPVEQAGRAEADELAREVELEPADDLDDLTDPEGEATGERLEPVLAAG